jgi:C4-dicarboxylate transporter DctM subunit
MTGIELASWSFPVLLALIFIRVPIGLAMAVCGLVGAYFIYGSHAPILNQLKRSPTARSPTTTCRSCRCSC